MSNTRKLYDRCYRAWRKHATHEAHDIWRDQYPIYRAAADTYVNNVDGFGGWINKARWWAFECRKMDLIYKAVST